MELTFLGTGSMVPTKERNHSAAFLRFGKEGILMDCGEGTQRQLRLAGIPASKITRILISHWHGDHVLGLPGLLMTMGSMDYEGTVQIYGPIGTKKHFAHMQAAFKMEDSVALEVHEVDSGVFFESKLFNLETLPLDHTTLSNGYSLIEHEKIRVNPNKMKALGLKEGPEIGDLQDGKSITVGGKVIKPGDVTYKEPGKKITFIPDTALTENCFKLAEDADVLISESTYADDLEEKANLYKHMTASQAGLIANKAGVKKLILTHFSQRYKNTQQIEEDARTVFDNVTCAEDFMTELI